MYGADNSPGQGVFIIGPRDELRVEGSAGVFLNGKRVGLVQTGGIVQFYSACFSANVSLSAESAASSGEVFPV